jgi:hypothetical protein
MQTRILSNSAQSRVLWHDHGDGRVTVQQVADVSAGVERAKALHNAGAHTTGMGDKHVASIPIPVLTEWAAKRGKSFADVVQDSCLMQHFLQDPDNGVFRVWKGHL